MFLWLKFLEGEGESHEVRCQRLNIPNCVQHLAILVDADHLVGHGDLMLLGPLRIPKKGVRDPQLAHQIAIQNKGLKGVIVTKAFIIPCLVEDDVNGVFLAGRTENHTLGAEHTKNIHV